MVCRSVLQGCGGKPVLEKEPHIFTVDESVHDLDPG